MIEIVRGDITTLDVDAIVNAANEALAPGGGVCGAIYRAAGPELFRTTNGIDGCATGNAVLTPGFALPARFVIHAVGPIWHGGSTGETDLLRQAYDSAFRVARGEPTIRTIAFPAISTGIYGFPKSLAADIAIRAMHDHERAFDRIVACLFDEETERCYAAALRQLR